MLNIKKINRVVIVGGGTAGWMAAAAMSKLLHTQIDVTLIESDEVSTVGVGEATMPTMHSFHALLGINEQAFLRATNGTFKLGISFEHWRAQGVNYIHAFGKTGKESWAGEFQHYWLKGKELGIHESFGDYCLELQAAKAGKFAISEHHCINYAYHIDALAYAKFLRTFSEEYGVTRIEGIIKKVNLHLENGFIASVELQSGQIVEGDLFIDCSDFHGLLIEKALHTGYEDWSHWLPCDSAVTVQTESSEPPVPYTIAIAHHSGWRWKIPLQHRVSHGLVYCNRYVSDEDATKELLANIKDKPIGAPRVIKFKTGRRLKSWNKNCIALGLAGGFIEPLESTSMFLVSSSLLRLIKLFPGNGIEPLAIDEYNRQADQEIELIRDFIILHYKATERADSPFWRQCRAMPIPESLAHRIHLFKETGRSFIGADELFCVDSWAQVMIGQGLIPKQYHPIVNQTSNEELVYFLHGFRQHIEKNVSLMPTHEQFIKRYCANESYV